VDADQYVAQRVGRCGQAARFLQGGHAGPGRAVVRNDVSQLLVELPYAGDLQSQIFSTYWIVANPSSCQLHMSKCSRGCWSGISGAQTGRHAPWLLLR